MVEVRKGQYFVLGALIVGSLLALPLVIEAGTTEFESDPGTEMVFKRSMNEFPRFVNAMVAENGSANYVQRHVTSYMSFQDYLLGSKGFDGSSHAVVGIPGEDNFTVVVSNHRGETMENIHIEVGQDSRDPSPIPGGESGMFTFDSGERNVRFLLEFEADRNFTHSFGTDTGSYLGIYSLRMETRNRVWDDTRVYD